MLVDTINMNKFFVWRIVWTVLKSPLSHTKTSMTLTVTPDSAFLQRKSNHCAEMKCQLQE